ncbi:MAG: hypothetical protein KF805_00305 [Phycisphaeraceae bacterium]|nr:hypothetical protein [Phycisphaeraceae bacterium]
MTRDLRRLHRLAWFAITPLAGLLLILSLLARRHTIEILRTNAAPIRSGESR